MTAKETLVEALREEGWGFIDACEHVQRWLDEFKSSSDRKTIVHTKTKSFLLRKLGSFLNSDEEQGETHECESPWRKMPRVRW